MCRHQMRGPEPRRQRKPCAVHRCARRDRSLAAATVAFVSVCPAPQRGRAGVAASGTNESIRPATFEQEGRAARLVGKRRLKFGERSRPRHRVLPWSPIAGLNKGWIPHWRTWDNAISHVRWPLMTTKTRVASALAVITLAAVNFTGLFAAAAALCFALAF